MSAALPAETVRSRTPAQIEASRQNGARSHGPATPEGKARSARNGTRHGLCSATFFLLPDEDPEAFAAFEHGMLASLNPEDEAELHAAARAVQAMWREIRADRLEAEVLTDLFAANRIEDETARGGQGGGAEGARHPDPLPQPHPARPRPGAPHLLCPARAPTPGRRRAGRATERT